MSDPCIMVATLGASWAVVPEVYSWLAPEPVDLYGAHPARTRLHDARSEWGLRPPDEIWVVTTGGSRAAESVAMLRRWWSLVGQPCVLRTWLASDSDELADADECRSLRELVFRVTLLASEHVGRAGQLVLSLAGGRKTMSADLQEAGSWFGADALVHVVGRDAEIRKLPTEAAGFLGPLDSGVAAGVWPILLGRTKRSELVDVALDGSAAIVSINYPVGLPETGAEHQWTCPRSGLLINELDSRQRQSHRLIGNLIAKVAAEDRYPNWLSLYRLPAGRIESLRRASLGAGTDAEWLGQLPKADLHRHLGGCLGLEAQREVARAIWESRKACERDVARAWFSRHLGSGPWPTDWPGRLRREPDRPLLSASALLLAPAERLQAELYRCTEPRLALATTAGRGFEAYERPGELSGSALLTDASAIAEYAARVVAYARSEGLLYLELRGSPHKYRNDDPVGFLRELEEGLRVAGAQTTSFEPSRPGPRVGFLWILDRRQRELVPSVVASAVRALEELPQFMLGLDLAGDEGTRAPADIAPDFAPAFEACMRITIHAGEGEPAENIWQAAYHLHADRIGHGLTLADDGRLAQRFRDRGTALELCPTSNREVVGFRDPAYPESEFLGEYPLRRLMDQGVPLTLCTDNPGFSGTTLAGEYVVAARMTRGGLSRWDALALVRQGFAHAFLPSAERDAILREADRRIFERLVSDEPDESR